MVLRNPLIHFTLFKNKSHIFALSTHKRSTSCGKDTATTYSLCASSCEAMQISIAFLFTKNALKTKSYKIFNDKKTTA
jgi:hypothetical protein